jgi:hypothetical protein
MNHRIRDSKLYGSETVVGLSVGGVPHAAAGSRDNRLRVPDGAAYAAQPHALDYSSVALRDESGPGCDMRICRGPRSRASARRLERLVCFIFPTSEPRRAQLSSVGRGRRGVGSGVPDHENPSASAHDIEASAPCRGFEAVEVLYVLQQIRRTVEGVLPTHALTQ